MNFIEFNTRTENNGLIRFYDFLVDGISLYDLCRGLHSNRIGVLGWGLNPLYERSLVHQFMGMEKNQELRVDRVPLFVCSKCGDIECGATTFRLRVTDDLMIWEEFGNEDTRALSFEPFTDPRIGPFQFGKKEYLDLFKNYRDQI